ncbi:hypothetical protein SLPG_00052 [Salicola phage CGphi29]|uniref:hypothetical protein n=1 Tax=Salicola phage CGphi29 TaxID=754067 RepID=UPI0002C0954F|nr:hypothetical protein SLPG_00052 [Salicola phage CGphi29]AGH31846.1 hypothetical protein SLPG_00052 [Salicola phage CGphi29]
MIDLIQIPKTQWLEGYSRACRMENGQVRNAYIRRLVATAPGKIYRDNARELLK